MFVVVTILCNYHDSIIIEIIIAIVAFPLSPGLALGNISISSGVVPATALRARVRKTPHHVNQQLDTLTSAFALFI